MGVQNKGTPAKQNKAGGMASNKQNKGLGETKGRAQPAQRHQEYGNPKGPVVGKIHDRGTAKKR